MIKIHAHNGISGHLASLCRGVSVRGRSLPAGGQRQTEMSVAVGGSVHAALGIDPGPALWPLDTLRLCVPSTSAAKQESVEGAPSGYTGAWP